MKKVVNRCRCWMRCNCFFSTDSSWLPDFWYNAICHSLLCCPPGLSVMIYVIRWPAQQLQLMWMCRPVTSQAFALGLAHSGSGSLIFPWIVVKNLTAKLILILYFPPGGTRWKMQFDYLRAALSSTINLFCVYSGKWCCI